MLNAASFTYASPDHHPLQRLCIKTIEKLTGQVRIWRLYYDYTTEDPASREDFWNAAIKKLEVTVDYDRDALAAVPKTGPLVVVANHPFGVLDGLIITQLMKQVRLDFKVLTNSVLCRAPEAADDLLPIDFAENEAALATNIATRKAARALLKQGGCIVVFPAGGVSSIPTWKDKIAQDTQWQPFIGRLIHESGAGVVPVFFEGQNSRLFQVASLYSITLRLALIFKEVCDKIGARIGVRIGKVIPYEEMAPITDRAKLCHWLRTQTYRLGGMDTLPPPKAAYRIEKPAKSKS